MVDDISACLTVKELKASLQKMPTGLKFAYDATIQRIRAQGEGRSRRAFEVMKWVMLAKRPLASAEIEHAVSIEIGSKDIDLDDLVSAVDLATLCAGLVIVDQNDRFRFSHQTVSEYLSTNHGHASEDQRKSVADCCITYLMYDTFSKGPCSDLAEFRDRLSRYPLYVYSSCYWYRQMDGGPTADQKTIALRFFSSEAHWRSARQAARSGQTKDEEMLPHARLWGDVVLHHAAYLNAHHIFEDLYDMDRSALNRRNELGRTPLMRAAVARSLQFAKKLIDVGADINPVDNAGDTALHIAAWKRDLPMIDLILSTSSVELEQGIKIRSSLRTAIFQAADNHDFEIMQRLILRGAAAADAAILTLYESPRGHSQSLDACNIEDLLSCFQDVPYGDYVAFEYRLKDHQDLLDTDPSAHMLLCGALRDLRDGNTSQAQKLVQLSFIVRECGLLAPLDREAFFKSLRASHKDILGRINVDFSVIMKSFSVAVQLYGALHESSYQKDEASSNAIKDEDTGGAVLPPASPRDKMGYMWEEPESPFLAPWRRDFLLVDEEQFSGDEQGQISLSDKGHQSLENPSDATIPQSHRRALLSIVGSLPNVDQEQEEQR
jgi:Ankyrin repeats (many copies)